MNVTLLTVTSFGTGATLSSCVNDIANHAPSPITVVIALLTVIGQLISYKKTKLLLDANRDKKQDKEGV
jgi:hypothetical protein